MLLLLWSTAAVLVVSYLLLHYRRYRASECPGPYAPPFVGNLFECWRYEPVFLDWILEQTHKYGKTWKMKVAGDDWIQTVDPVNVEYILKTNFANYHKGEMFREIFGEMLGDGIFNVSGDKWYNQRKIASLLFKVSNFRDNMIVVFNRHAQKLAHKLSMLQPHESMNMFDMFMRLTLDAIGDIGFGVDVNSLDERVEFAQAFDAAQHASTMRFVYPWWKICFTLNKRLNDNVAKLDAFAYRIIAERRKDPELEQRHDFLSLFMTRTDEKGEKFDDKFLRDIVINFAIAGRDTTGQCLSWLFYMLATHPEVEAKVTEEVDRVLHGEPPTFESLKELRYTQAVVNETLRLYPSVPKDGKQCASDDVLPDGVKVRKGSWVAYLPHTMGRMEFLWGKDALEFKPERFLTEENRKPSPFKFTAFQAGPRTCLGQNMAYYEVKTVVSIILQRFRLRLVPNQTITYQNNLTLPMRYGMNMYMEPRSATGK